MDASDELGRDVSLTNVLAVLPDRLVERATIVVRDGRIDRIAEGGTTSGRVVEGRGAVVVPGLIDAHGRNVDQLVLAGAGVTTQLREVTFTVPDRDPVAACHAEADGTIDVRPLVLLDLDDPGACVRAVDCVRGCRDDDAPLVVSVDDHRALTDGGRVPDDDPLHWFAIQAAARRLRLGVRAPQSADDIDRAVDWGASLAEFPVTIEAARRARERGLAVIVGVDLTANHQRAVSADVFVELGLADGLAALDTPSSLIDAVSSFVLRGVADLPTAVRLVTTGPAEAYGLVDRGRLAGGQRADLALLRARGDRFLVEATLSADGQLIAADEPQPDVQSSA